MPKLFVPTIATMTEAVRRLWKRAGLEEASQGTSLEGDLTQMRRYMADGDTGAAIVCLQQSTWGLLFEALCKRWAGTDEYGAGLFRQSFAYFVLAHALRRTHRRTKPLSDQMREGQLMDLVNWQGLAAAGGAPWYLTWTAPFLHNLFCCGVQSPQMSLFSYTSDLPARNFVVCLQEAVIRQRWPVEPDAAAMGIYGRLIANAASPAAFDAALLDFCNDRVAQAFGYEVFGGTKRRRQSALENIHDRFTWEQAFPVELLVLKHVFESTTGKHLSLDAAHPLLQTNLMKLPFPKLDPLHEDDITREVEAYGRQTFGTQWDPRETVEAKYLQR
jgi:hypothetical protein